MESQSCSFTEQMVLFVIGECEPDEAVVLSAHLNACPFCREEAELLQQSWQMLPYYAEEADLPADLKKEVMEAIFPSAHSETGLAAGWHPRDFIQRLKFPLQSWLTGALLVALVLSLWNNWSLHQQLQDAKEAIGVPAQVQQAYALKSFDPAMSTAKGDAWIYQQGEKRQLVFHLQGLSATHGQETYQIWLINNGKRSSCGVFHVDQQGNGVLTYELTEQTPSFQAIGITLEPDSNGTQPRGKKVLGT